MTLADGIQGRLLTVAEAGSLLRQAPATVYRHVRLGRLEALRIGDTGPLRFHPEALSDCCGQRDPKRRRPRVSTHFMDPTDTLERRQRQRVAASRRQWPELPDALTASIRGDPIPALA